MLICVRLSSPDHKYFPLNIHVFVFIILQKLSFLKRLEKLAIISRKYIILLINLC